MILRRKVSEYSLKGCSPEVIEVISGMPAEQCGIQKGDIITEVNGIEISDPHADILDLIRENANKDRLI